ncbi:MAG: J domain-containing protein [Mycoplasmataceae bacterium]|nr:J domain-containing protein [Mycoplasmataceae bacterium]
MFGGGRKTTSTNQRTNPSQYPLNIESEITISFLESILGADKKIKYHVKKPCPHCHGTGANTPDAVKTCPRCNGSGYVRIRQRTPIGIMESQGICSECHGTGKVITDYCKVCGGNKYIETEEVISIDIPSGISNGERFKISGKGNVGKNGPGDLIIKIFINPSKVFSRKNNTVYANAIVDPILAITGGKIKIPTPYGIKEIELKANTANGEEITVSEMGIRNSNKKLLKNINGDLVITIVYASPKRYSKSDLDVLRSINNGTNQEVEKFVETIRKELEK